MAENENVPSDILVNNSILILSCCASLVRSFTVMAAPSCVDVQETTLWSVSITLVIPLKSVGRWMVFQAAILKVRLSSQLYVPAQHFFMCSFCWPWSLFILLDTSTCIASGDPHYKTFDRRSYDFMGNCSYLMSAPCNKTFVPYFEVHADNENRYNQFRVSYLKAVHVYVHNTKISILKGGTVQVTTAGLCRLFLEFFFSKTYSYTSVHR